MIRPKIKSILYAQSQLDLITDMLSNLTKGVSVSHLLPHCSPTFISLYPVSYSPLN